MPSEFSGRSPARFVRSEGIIYTNSPIFDKLEDHVQDFIIAHELGHIKTKDEFLADKIGFAIYIELGYTPKQAIDAVNKSLSFRTKDHNKRFLEIVNFAANYDYQINNNINAKKLINMNNIVDERDLRLIKSRCSNYDISDDEINNFLGLTKASRERREKRQERKDARTEARNAIRQSRANIRNAKAGGISDGTWKQTDIGGIFNNVSDTAKSIFGRGNQDQEIPVDDQTKDNTALFVGIGLVVVVAVVIFFVTRKKK
jgi:hypothetical protein